MRNRKIKYYPCGCCEYRYRDAEMAKGSHYEIGDDDDVRYQRRGKKANASRKKPVGCPENNGNGHLYEVVQHDSWMNRWTRERGYFTIPYTYYQRECVGCGKVKVRDLWRTTIDESAITEVYSVTTDGPPRPHQT